MLGTVKNFLADVGILPVKKIVYQTHNTPVYTDIDEAHLINEDTLYAAIPVVNNDSSKIDLKAILDITDNFDVMTYTEIAHKLNISVNAARKRVAKSQWKTIQTGNGTIVHVPKDALKINVAPVRVVWNKKSADDAAMFFRMFATEDRINILACIALTGRNKEISVTNLARRTGMLASHLSIHLGKMRQQGLVSSRRVGTNMMYKITDPTVIAVLNAYMMIKRID